MTETKHFNYDANIDLRQENKPEVKPEVTGVEFMTPARVTLVKDGKKASVMVNIDIINRMVYDNNGDAILTDLVFKHLDDINILPEDFYVAPEELHEKVAEIETERLQQTSDILGEHNE